jgi:cytochrome P450
MLARLEAKIFIEELLRTFATIELAGEPKGLRSNLINGLKHLPIAVSR